MRALHSGKIASAEAAFWFSLFVFFVLADQIYGNYFVSSGTFFMLGTSAKIASRCHVPSPESDAASVLFPKISVITPSYNQAEFLDRTIRSVLDQNYPNLEYIVIDGGSTDGSVDIIKKYADRIDYWVSERDAGQTDAINKGFKRATGEWVGWQNSDDMYYPGAFLSLAKVAENRPDADLIVANVNLVDSSDGVIRDMRYVAPSYRALLAEGMVLTNQAAFWRRRVHSEIGWLNQKLHFAFDYDWFLRLTKNRYGVHVDEIWGGYRFHGETKTSLHANRFSEENREILKGHPPISSLMRQIYKVRRLALHLVNGDFRYFARGLWSRITGKHSVPF